MSPDIHYEHTLRIEGLRVTRGTRLVAEMDHLSLKPGQIHAIMGPNGAGKSSVLLSLPVLVPATWTSYELLDRQVDPRDAIWARRQISVVFQEPLLLEGDVLHNTSLGLVMRGTPREDAERTASTWLDRLGVGKLKNRHYRALSGGEAQRVSIARALCTSPRVLLLDEPFSSLDVVSRLTLLDEIKPLLEESGTAALLVTHDFSEAALLASCITVMESGRVLQTGAPGEIMKSPKGPLVTALVQFARKMGDISREEDSRGIL